MSEIEKPVLTLEQDRFLKNKSFDTYKKKLEVLSKKEIKKFLAHGIFRRGTTIEDIEKNALYTTL